MSTAAPSHPGTPHRPRTPKVAGVPEARPPHRATLRDHGLSLAMLVLFAGSLVAQSFAGLASFNEEQLAHGLPTATWAAFVALPEFVVDVAENWQSEFLQFMVFIALTVWFVQRGSPESKRPGDEGRGTDAEQLVGVHARPDSPAWAKVGGIRRWIFANSLLLVMSGAFAGSLLVQGLAGTTVYNHEQALVGQPSVSLVEYLVSSDFWNRTLQNWQSEFLAVGCMVGFTIFLRQRGSPESKPVGAPHAATGGATQ